MSKLKPRQYDYCPTARHYWDELKEAAIEFQANLDVKEYRKILELWENGHDSACDICRKA